MTQLRDLSSSLASDAAAGTGVLPPFVRPLAQGQRVVGPARIALVGRDDNGAIRDLLDAGARHDGEVLVVAGSNASGASVTGGITVIALARAGFAALVTDGLVRDSAELRVSGLPIWCRGASPIAPRHRSSPRQPRELTFGHVIIRDGDLVVADDDGVVVWPGDGIERLLAAATAKEQADAERLAGILAG